MGILDIVFIVILGLTAVSGFLSGLVKQVLSLFFLILAFYVSNYFSGIFVPADAGYITTKLYTGITFSGLFIATYIIGFIVKFFVGMLINVTALSFIDKLIGAGFGLLRGIFFGLILVLVLSYTPMHKSDYWENSNLVPYYEGTLNMILGLMGEESTDERSGASEPESASLPPLTPKAPSFGYDV
jgi:membrane protein required for colicin V production